MPKLRFDTPLSSTGIRDQHLDLSKALLSGETLAGTSPTVTAHDKDGSVTSLVTISVAGINTITLTNDNGTTVAPGLAVQWKATTDKAGSGQVFIHVVWAVANLGSADTHEIEQDVAVRVTE